MTHETQAAFAKRLGVTRSYVNKLKESGRLVITEGSLVDVEASLAAIQATQDPSKPSHVIPPPTIPEPAPAPRAAASSGDVAVLLEAFKRGLKSPGLDMPALTPELMELAGALLADAEVDAARRQRLRAGRQRQRPHTRHLAHHRGEPPAAAG